MNKRITIDMERVIRIDGEKSGVIATKEGALYLFIIADIPALDYNIVKMLFTKLDGYYRLALNSKEIDAAKEEAAGVLQSAFTI